MRSGGCSSCAVWRDPRGLNPAHLPTASGLEPLASRRTAAFWTTERAKAASPAKAPRGERVRLLPIRDGAGGGMPEADPPNFFVYTVRLRHPARCVTVTMHRSDPLPFRRPRRCRGGDGSSRWRLALPGCPRSSGPIRTPRIVEEGPAAPRNRPGRPPSGRAHRRGHRPPSPRTIPVIIRARFVGRRSGDDTGGCGGGDIFFSEPHFTAEMVDWRPSAYELDNREAALGF